MYTVLGLGPRRESRKLRSEDKLSHYGGTAGYA